MTSSIVIRKCQTLDEFHLCVALQREIWQEADLEIEPATAFVVAAKTGGQVLGAFDGQRLAGYTLAVAGILDGIPYLHSHMTGIHADFRDRGVVRVNVMGLATQFSVEHTVRDAADIGFGVRLFADCCASGDMEAHRASLRTLTLLADVMDSDDVLPAR